MNNSEFGDHVIDRLRNTRDLENLIVFLKEKNFKCCSQLDEDTDQKDLRENLPDLLRQCYEEDREKLISYYHNCKASDSGKHSTPREDYADQNIDPNNINKEDFLSNLMGYLKKENCIMQDKNIYKTSVINTYLVL